jgi:hypothetical protein
MCNIDRHLPLLLISCHAGSNNIVNPIFLITYLGVIPDRSLLV